MIYEQEITLIAHRYAELLNIAKCSFENYQIFTNSCNNGDYSLYCRLNKLSGGEHLIICITFSISAIEAFVNHLGYILDDDWVASDYETMNFHAQYKRLGQVLKLHGISDNFLINSYPDFYIHRQSIRNPIHHPHASKHDSAYSTTTVDDPHKNFNVQGSEFLNLWANISINDAEKAINGASLFITNVVTKLKITPTQLDDSKRDDLLHHLIDFPFSHTPLVSGRTSIIN